ncbi:allophanate hydrolase [Curtobacterium sp. MCBA15_004]|uniref:allophanate hydrolase n=1 Tax=unclassified Curtobacterium TaxID=257496 RepID=UPI0008DCCF19|nr:allophanate hydrolase [Curtobacterium sp. MCBA15_004]WIA98218.1 allophanate hydrolase [Curtobacterium sp. MCBA15_004]
MSTTTPTFRPTAAAPTPDPVARVTAAYERIASVDRPEVWITLRDRDDALARARTVQERLDTVGAERLPLAGTVIAVKDNIDVAGLPTTCAAPWTGFVPDESATAVARLEDAGAVVIGKTNLDQFATGLVGTRSPHGVVRNAFDPGLVSGGSSSGSAVATALGIVDAALGTDTAGSGRVPAAYNRLVGIKPTLGLVPARGMAPAAPSYDTVTVFAPTLAVAEHVAAVITGVDPLDPTSRAWDPAAPAAAPPTPRLAIAREPDLAPLSPAWRASYDQTLEVLRAAGAELVETDITPLLDAAKLLYDGALVAERTYAVGHHLDPDHGSGDPSVTAIIRGGHGPSAVDLVADQQTLRRAALTARTLLGEVDALLLPTAPGHPSIADVQADPIGVNSWVGTFTNFVNLLDLAAIAVPGAEADGRPFGVTLIGPAFSDAALADLADRFLLHETGRSAPWRPPTIDIAVFGAHMSGQPLNRQLTDLGAVHAGPAVTAPRYRLHALPTTPPKPGLVRVHDGGAAITGERWSIPAARVGTFLTQLVAPMTVGVVELGSGDTVLGFLCEPLATVDAPDITDAGSWRSHLAAR